MNWLIDLLTNLSAVQSILILSISIAGGLHIEKKESPRYIIGDSFCRGHRYHYDNDDSSSD